MIRGEEEVEVEVNKAPRLPRWTRQELLVLIQGKRVAENRVRTRLHAQSQSQSQVEPKWSSVSSYCKRHGVNRGPVQCRKRWSNLAGDFKKIKEWEAEAEASSESFWVMRNDLRRERKLPGFFDKEVYDILNGGSSLLLLSLPPSQLQLQLQPPQTQFKNENEQVVVFDSGRPDDNALFSDAPNNNNNPNNEDQDQDQDHAAPTPISAANHPPPPPPATEANNKETSPSPETYHQENKRKRKRKMTHTEEDDDLIEAMERNGRLLSSQLEIQNTNSRLDREQRNHHANTLFALLNKLADAMLTIADKL